MIYYLAVSLEYCMWQKKESKMKLAAAMVRQVMQKFSQKKNVIILCDSRYVKQSLVTIVDEYPNLYMIGNVRADSIIYDLDPAPTGTREVMAYITPPCKEGGIRRIFLACSFQVNC